MGIIIIDQKSVIKDAKKIADAADYVFINGTDKEGSKLDRFTNIVSMPGFNPPAKCLKSDKELLDSDASIRKALKNWLKSKDLEKGIKASCKTLVNADGKINIVIVLRKRAYKRYGKTILKKFEAVTGVSGNYVQLYKDISKKDMRKPTKASEIKKLRKFFEKHK